MPKNVPAEFTGRFSIKPKKSRSKLKVTLPGSSTRDVGDAPVPDNLRDEPMTFQERKRKASQDESVAGGSSRSAASQSKDDEDEEDEDEEGLSLYSQQLQAQSPYFRGPSQHSDQSDLPDQQLGLASQHLHLHDQQSPRSEAEAGEVSVQERALRILSTSWTRFNGSQLDISATAHKIANSIAAYCVPEVTEEVLQGAVLAVVECSADQPKSIDFMLRVFDDATKLLSTTRSNHKAISLENALQPLIGWLTTTSLGFRGSVRAESVGTIDLEDRSNIKFRYPDVSANLEGVLDHISTWQKRRRMWIVAAAMHSRCLSLKIVRIEEGRQALSVVDAGLDRRHHKWSKADMVGACVLLRGCAKSLLAILGERGIEGRRNEWKSLLESFLLQDNETWDNDFVIKAHAALTLRNLVNGPFDESSEQLFTSETWIY